MRVRLSEDARRFLRAEAEYLRRRNPSAAHRFLESIRLARTNLAEFPLIGATACDSLVPGSRRLVVGPYVLTYDVRAETVEVAAIRHGRMQDPGPKVEDDFDYEAEASMSRP
ncbi:hypothetical protein GCM10011390_48820 [Aureimonas endophytica]|uniref:Plasmid stabilization system protein ParE n=1 Tax=Aureimonas endophytica TaxID=2027858 RepID=A0A917A2J6_9HYPH|nr:type II toxin-antitoxin system RelE/ParE family toxin [Aureimonas endophytica]GGE23633.1 hypothetical protein GCM10011390_48820 [Aureimonas endophytica]